MVYLKHNRTILGVLAVGIALAQIDLAPQPASAQPAAAGSAAEKPPAAAPVSAEALKAAIRTPQPPATPRINGPAVFGVRPASPLLYHIPATGDRPLEFSVDGLPAGVQVNAKTGQISGSLKRPGEYVVTLRAKNSLGSSEKKFRIVVGEQIALTPPLGWNSWNCWGPMVDAEKVRQSAQAMVNSGLINHGWTYVNIDDAWQGRRGGPLSAIQPNDKFPDMPDLCNEIHNLGLKVGIYSTPCVTSYAGYVGGSADNPEGTWTPPPRRTPGTTAAPAAGGPAAPAAAKPPATRVRPTNLGKFTFAENDAKQWAAWGIDYMKYDWNPNEFPETAEMAKALRSCGRDIVFSLSNSMPFRNIGELSKLANCWRITGDIRDSWGSMASKGFGQDRWQPYAGPGHWNDPDMMVVGYVDVGKGRNLHPSNLTPDEQYTHVSMWCLVSSPMLLGCDMARLDEFTLNLLTNDEVLAVNQDSLGKQATCVSKEGTVQVQANSKSQQQVAALQVYAKDLEDGSKAVGLFNLGNEPAAVTAKWSDLKLSGPAVVRDLWRQKDLGQFDGQFQATVAPHGAELLRIQAKAAR